MEPPIGYGSTHRSIFPESQFGTTAAPCFRGRLQEVQTGSMPLLVRLEIAQGGVLKSGMTIERPTATGLHSTG
jgi:hypothetical protein